MEAWTKHLAWVLEAGVAVVAVVVMVVESYSLLLLVQSQICNSSQV